MFREMGKMLNRCKFLNIVLHICGISNAPCQYMADPHSCPNYDEDFDRSYIDSYKREDGQPNSPAEITQIAQAETRRTDMEVESLGDFANRIESELNGMGIKTERDNGPDRPCGVCGMNKWWQRKDGGWVCGGCHPKPVEKTGEEAPDWF